MTLTAGKPQSGELGDVSYVVLTDEQGWVGEVRAEFAPLFVAASGLLAACKRALDDATAVRDFLAEAKLGPDPCKPGEELAAMVQLRVAIARAESK